MSGVSVEMLQGVKDCCEQREGRECGGGQELDRMKREQLYRCYLLGVGGR